LTVELSSIEKEHDVTESEDVDYYTKVYLLSFIHGPIPVGTSTGRGKVFLSQDDVARLPERDHSRMEKDLPLADHLSLFMVASAEGDVASTCIHYSQLGRVTIFIAKNETSIADEIQMQRLLGLCSGDVSRHKDFKDFALKGLGFIATFCQGKLRKRMKAVRPDMLQKVATMISRGQHPVQF
jgi:hypothetical protein